MKAEPVGTRSTNYAGYVSVKTAMGQRKWPFEHIVVWESIHGLLPKGWEIHHKDENKQNNSPSNLVACASSSEHLKQYHSDTLRENGRKVGQWNRGKPKSPEHRAKIARALVHHERSPEHCEAIRQGRLGKVYQRTCVVCGVIFSAGCRAKYCRDHGGRSKL